MVRSEVWSDRERSDEESGQKLSEKEFGRERSDEESDRELSEKEFGRFEEDFGRNSSEEGSGRKQSEKAFGRERSEERSCQGSSEEVAGRKRSEENSKPESFDVETGLDLSEEDFGPKSNYECITTLVFSFIMVMVLGIFATVKIAEGTEFTVGDKITLTVTLSVFLMVMVWNIVKYRNRFHLRRILEAVVHIVKRLTLRHLPDINKVSYV